VRQFDKKYQPRKKKVGLHSSSFHATLLPWKKQLGNYIMLLIANNFLLELFKV